MMGMSEPHPSKCSMQAYAIHCMQIWIVITNGAHRGLCSYLVLLLPDSIDKGIICQPSDCFSAIVNS